MLAIVFGEIVGCMFMYMRNNVVVGVGDICMDIVQSVGMEGKIHVIHWENFCVMHTDLDIDIGVVLLIIYAV